MILSNLASVSVSMKEIQSPFRSSLLPRYLPPLPYGGSAGILLSLVAESIAATSRTYSSGTRRSRLLSRSDSLQRSSTTARLPLGTTLLVVSIRNPWVTMLWMVLHSRAMSFATRYVS